MKVPRRKIAWPVKEGHFPGDAFGSLAPTSPRSESSLNTYPRVTQSPASVLHVTPRFLSSGSELLICFELQMASRSPTVATPLPKSSAAPESPPKDATPSPETVPFPPPQTFDIIPPLHGILLRLLSQKGASSAAGGPPGGATGAPGASADAQTSGQEASSSIPGGGNNDTAQAQATGEVPVLDPSSNPPLDIKDLPTATSSVKIRIQKAWGVVEALPDVHRSIEEQQNEIDELEDRVARLRSVIADFGSRAGMSQTDRAQVTAS